MVMIIEMGIGWVPSDNGPPGQIQSAKPSEYVAEIERLRAVLRAISQLGAENDLVDAWTLARAALEPHN